MARLIDADLLLENYDLKNADKSNPEGYDTLMKYEVADMIEDAPTVEAVPVVHGIWLNFYGDYSTAECDQCAALYEVSPDIEPREEYFEAFSKFYKFCPDCGADMRKEKKCDARIL